MELHKYSKRRNGEVRDCAVCGQRPQHIDTTTGQRVGSVVQHHVGMSKYDDRCIWVCNECHQKIHNPRAFGLPSSWAYDNKYLLRWGDRMKKEKKIKKCTHSKSYYNAQLDKITCQFCGQEVDDIKYGTKKKVEPITRKYRKGKGGAGNEKNIATKMGYEKQDPRIAQAEGLKRERAALSVQIKKEKDPETKTALQVTLAGVVKEMRALQKTYGGA